MATSEEHLQLPPPALPTVARRPGRSARDRLAKRLMALLTVAVTLMVPLVALALLQRARPLLEASPLAELLFSSTWRPQQGAFGFYPFILGTLWVTVLAMVIAVPPSLLAAIYLAEYASRRTHAWIKPAIDLLAGIPSVVYGVWGVLTVVPALRALVASPLGRSLNSFPLLQGTNPTGYCVLAGALVLSVMVFPLIISVAEEVIRAVPQGVREASLSLGATRWETVRHVVLRRALPGVMAAVVLGFSRAFGETMAVLMVVGNVPQVPRSLFDPAYPLTALIANSYGEMMSVPLYDAALLGAALLVLLVVVAFVTASRVVLVRAVRGE